MGARPEHHEDDSAPASHDATATVTAPSCYALLGNPNSGKTTLFNRLCGIRAKTANFPGSTVDARIGLPDPAAVEALIVTGSAAMVTDREAWSVAAGAFLRSVVERGAPVLAICYGHQLLAE